jgi:large subunit ribosomal protein L13
MLINAENLVLGRLATVAAKRALLGEKIVVVNCQKALISGTTETIFARYSQKRNRGIPARGPFFPRQSDRLVRRTIRGMLPHRQAKGRAALERVMCYKDVPTEYVDKKADSVDAKPGTAKHMALGQLCKLLGGS